MFFVITGYLITNQIGSRLKSGDFSFRNFYERRIRRIFPSLAFMLTVLTVVEWFLLPVVRLKEYSKHLMGAVAFVANIVFSITPDIYDSYASQKPLLHLWSMGVEEQFFIFWPVILFLSWKLTRTFLPILLFLLVISFYWNISRMDVDPLGTFFLLTTRIWEILAGAALCFYDLKNIRDSRRLADISSACGLAIFIYALFFLSSEYRGFNALCPIMGGFLIISAGPNAFFNRNFLSHPAIVWIGLISYPLYLWHWPIYCVIRQLKIESTGTMVAGMAFSFFVAWLTYKYIEKPLRTSNSPKTTPALCIAMALLFFVATMTYYLN